MDKIDLQKIDDFTRLLLEKTFCDADYDLWYSHLCRESVFICNSEPMLIGDIAIRSHFDTMPKIKSNIANIDFCIRSIGNFEAQTYGSYILSSNQYKINATVFFSITYQLNDKKIEILLQHFFYDYHVLKENKNDSALSIDLNTVEFVRTMLLNVGGSRMKIKSGIQTVFLDPFTILYIESRRNKTEFICVDRNVICNQSISEIKELLPDYFYMVRRGTIINLRYVIAIRRFEIELISKILIQIPERNYKKIKDDVSERIHKILAIK